MHVNSCILGDTCTDCVTTMHFLVAMHPSTGTWKLNSLQQKLWPQFSKKWLTRSPKIALVLVLHCERTRVVFTELAWLICKVATGKIKMFSPAAQEWSGGHAWHFCWDSCMCQLVAKYPLKASHVQVMRGH